ncbi:peptide chain release factor N(5)-glutamine methyltransferase [uncultured Ruminococcus sp.]|uniref:peptide chain release factor N(5)-glutamine methyltransferase n=1 Tax=uncultured Ruminococcus sp. TaxID=165186 RepID=UPI00292E1702|nr:peptide chain release factor N(5)-glutamine methyltransferase [uncultured Ruminococcus sp.]
MIVPALDNTVKSLLARAGVENPAGDAKEILCAVLACDRAQLLLREEEIPDPLCEKAIAMARRRAGGEPIQYILGSWSFMGRDYKVGEGVLIPRDDTEVVVTEALKRCERTPDPVIADLCAGSGIIAVTLAKELPNATVYAVEKSDTAFSYLTENIALHQEKIHAIHADLQDCVSEFSDGSLDMIVSNPPYIRSVEIADLQQEVQYEPRLALDGGEDGYDFYKMILTLWTPKLKDGGSIAFEIGEGQFDAIAAMLKNAGYADISGTPDIQNITRAITARYKW